MSHKLVSEKRQGYLNFHIYGEDSLEISKTYFEEVFNISAALEYDHCLIEESLQDSLFNI